MKVLVGYIYVLLPFFVAADIIVTTKNGQIQGKTMATPTDKTIYVFQGIPYAVPPVGDLRFQETTLSGSWEGILDATTEGKTCIGSFYNANSQSEDCLFLNVYVPSLNSSKKYPVMVHIHGGRYIGGSSSVSSYNPSYLVEKDVIVVTFNYRLGPFGFLSTGDLVIPGNAGMKDQVLALKWTNENIEAFGGDVSQITVFGQSAGGSACGLQVISKKAAGLFRAAICMSGSALSPWSVFRQPANFTYALANVIDSSITPATHTTAELGEFLKAQTPANIISAASVLENVFDKEGNRLTPTIEPEHDGAFLSENPYDLFIRGDFNRVPILIGIVSEEALAFVNSIAMAQSEAAKLDSQPEYIYPYDFEPRNPLDEARIERFIKDIYLGNGETFSDNLYQVVRFKSDDMFTRGIIKHAEMQSRFTDVYFYKFSYWGSLNNRHLDIPGAEEKCQHSDDMQYIFARKSGYASFPENDKLIINRMTTLWTNFVKYLNPTPEEDELLENLIWPKVVPGYFPYINITINFDILENPMEETYSKWNEVFYRWNKKPLTTF